jgi:spore germination cell wall hydrolase CwlJ-like protein
MAIIFFFLTFTAKYAKAEDINSYAIKTIAYEASNQSFEAQVAVASVIKTRMKERNMSSGKVVLQPKQFSCWNNKKPTQKRNLTIKELETALKAWNTAKEWAYNHYAHYKINNYWTKKAKSKLTIGEHVFYQL